MKKIILFVFTIVFFSVAKIYSQTLLYNFTQSSGTYTAITGGTSPGASFTGTGVATNAVSSAITLPFTFTFNGVAQTQIIISNNGFITFGATAPATTNYNPISAATAYGGAIAGYGLNLINSTVAGAATDISYTTLGTTPNRTFVVQFTDLSRSAIGATERMTFQIRLTETTNAINIVYGAWTTGSPTTTASSMGVVGLRGASNTTYNARAVYGTAPYNTWATSGGTGDNSATASQTNNSCTTSVNTVRFNTTYLPTSGQTYTWTPVGSSMFQSLPYLQNFESAWTNNFSVGDKPGNGIITNPTTGNQSVRASDVTTANAVWSGTLGTVTLGATQQTRAARFHDYDASSSTKGYMDIYLNFSSVGSKTLTFDYINTSGTDNCKVYLSTDGGLTFGAVLATYTTAASWTTQTLSLGSSTSSSCVLRFEYTGACGATDIYIDNINVFIPATPTITSYTPNTNLCTGGGQTITITGTNFTGATQVQFNGVNAASYSVVSATSITAETPSGLTAGNITVTTGGGTATSSAYTTFTNPTVSVTGSATKYCGNTPVTLTASGATTYTWSAITDLYTNATGTTAYTSLLDANPVYSKASADITYTVVGTTSGCTASNTVTVNKGNFITISSVTAQSPSACAGSTDSITVVSSISSLPNTYTLTSTSGSFTPLVGGTTITGGNADSYFSGVLPIGFNFNYNGTSYSNFYFSSNGFISLSAAIGTGTTNALATATSPVIAPLWDDLDGAAVGVPTYLTTGTIGSRVLTVQWLNWEWNYTTNAATISFQAKLYEADGRIEFIYRQDATAVSSPSASIGISGAVGNYLSLNGTGTSPSASSSTATTTLSTKPATGQVYTFTPPTLTYTWTSLNPSNTLIDNTLRTAVATVNATGKYQIVVSETGGCSALDSSLTVTLGGGVPTDTISAIPVATVAAKVCPGTSVTLSNTGLIGGCSPFTHKWNTGATTTTLTISPTVTTTYYDTITDASSQVVIGSYTVNVHPIVTASISPSTATVCGTSPVTLTASGGTIYRWSVNGSAAVTGLFTTTAATTAYTAGANQNPMYARPVSATTYAVTVTDANTCTASTTRTIAVGSPVTITSVTPQTLSACSGGTDSITVVASVASTANNYAFAASTGASLDPMTGATNIVASAVDVGSSVVTNIGFTFNFNGTNFTQFSASSNGLMGLGGTAITSADGNNSTTSNSIAPAWDDMHTCTDGNVRYINSGTAPNRILKVEWNYGNYADRTSAFSKNVQVWLYESSNKVEIRYGANTLGALNSATVGIVGASGNYNDVNTSTNINSTSAVQDANTVWPTSGTMYTFTPPTLTYAWTSLNPSNTLINTTLPTTVATITDTGKFQIVVTEAGGCSALDSTVKIFLGGGNPNITAMNTTNNSYCYTDSTTLSTTVLGGCPPYAYSWSGGLGSTASVKAKPTTTTKYYVTVTDNNTNVDIDSITVTIISPQILTVLGDTICGTDTARLSATANAGDSIVWYRSATGTNIVKFGANLDTVLSANDTFYVGATVITGTNTYNVGPPARVAALNYFISNNWGITFNASEPCVINSVAIYPSTAGIISIRAQSSMTTPTIFGTYSMNITAGQIGTKVIVPVNFVIPTAGTGYKMIVEAATTVTGLHRETPPAPGFAYSTVGSPISLPSSEWGGTTTGTYYFFYDWSVTKTTYCQSSRTPVVVVRNTPPTISATAPTFVCIGESLALNVTSPNDPNYTYTWNPGSLSGASQTVTPGSTTTYTVNAYDAITGCRASKDTIVQVRPYPTKPILNVDSVYLCNGTVQPLNITNGFNSGTASATSGTISLAIPDNSATGISSILNLSTVPTGATIDSVAVTFNLNHAYLADAEVTLTAPNGKVIALAADQGPSGTGSYVNTRISSNSANPALSSTSTPISGTYRANATVAGSLKGSFGANLTSTFSDLFTTANGNWTLTAFDDAPTDLGTLTSYSIDIYYRNTTSYSWTPTASLYTNAPATNGYTSGDSLTLYAKNTVNTNYISTATLNGCSTSDTAKYVIKSSSSSIALFSASTNGSPLTLDCEDAGWTYYADPSNNNRWLFGIDWDTNLVAKSTAQIALDYNTSGVIKDVKQRPGSSADYDGAYIMRRYWNVNNATLNAGSTPVKIRFFYDPADTTAARDSMDVNRVAYATASPGGNPYYATPWKWFKTVGVAFTPALINDGNNFSFSNIELTPSAMSTLNGVSYVQFDNITSFSGGSGGIGFTPHSGGVGLPVTLVSFAGNVEEAHNHIQWTTASELNNDHFELESSVDGKNFTTLATISGHGTTTETHQYSFNDYKYNMPSTYYRLKQVDFDGKSTTTNMIILTRMSNASTSAVVSVYPNPTNDITTLSIDVQENAEATYTIHDITGKIVSEGAINCIAGMNNTTIQTGDLADGMYIVDVLINGKHINTRLVKSTK